MKKSIIISLLVGLVGMMSFTSCLDTESNRFVDAKSELTEQDSVFRMLGILNGVKKISARYVLLGELRGDLMNTTNYASDDLRELNSLNISSTNSYVTQKEYYSIINQCNYIIIKGAALPKEQAVARIIRAWTYMQLALNYGKCQYYENIIDSKESADASYPEYDIKQLASVLIPQLEKVYADFNLDLRWPEYGSAAGGDLRTQMLDYRFVLADLYMWSAEPGDTDIYLRAANLYAEMIKSTRYANVRYYGETLSATYYGSSTDVYGNSVSQSFKSIKYLSRSALNPYVDPDESYSIKKSIYENLTNITVLSADSTKTTSNIDTLTTGAPLYEAKSIALRGTPRVRALWAGTKYAFVAGSTGICDESDYSMKPFYTYLNPLTPTYDFMGDLRAKRNYGIVSRGTSGGFVTDSIIGTYFKSKTVYLTRRTQLYLRWATAMTAAGKPNLAMVALKYGLNAYNIMLYAPDYEKTSKVDANGLCKYRVLLWDNSTNAKSGHSFLLNTGTPTTRAYFRMPADLAKEYNYKVPMRSTTTPDGDFYQINAASDTIFYLFNDTIESSYDFSSTLYGGNAGVHSRGAGCAAADTTFKMPYEMYPVSATATAEEREPLVQKQMAYMYDMICREYALESPFEGGRFHDLMMFSRLTDSPTFLANWMSYKDASFATKLAVPGDHTWDSKSWYLPKSSKEKYK